MSNAIIIERGEFDDLLESVSRLEELILGKAQDEVENRWLESEQARKMLGISPKTWQNWRDKRRLPFVQFGRKIWVRKSDIDAFLESNLIK